MTSAKLNSRKFSGKWQSKGLWKFWHEVDENLAKLIFQSPGSKQRATSILKAFIHERWARFMKSCQLCGFSCPVYDLKATVKTSRPWWWEQRGFLKMKDSTTKPRKYCLDSSTQTRHVQSNIISNRCNVASSQERGVMATVTSDRREVGQNVVSCKNVQQEQQPNCLIEKYTHQNHTHQNHRCVCVCVLR